MRHNYLVKERYNDDVSFVVGLLDSPSYKVIHIQENILYIKSKIDLDSLLQLISIDSDVEINFTKVNDEKSINDLIDVFSTFSERQVYVSENELYYRKLVSKVNYDDIKFLDFRDKFDELTLSIVRTYINNNFNVLKTAKELFVHRNTVNNNIRLFYRNTGLNPREIKDAFIIATIFSK